MKKTMSFYGKRVCFIGAHPDDIELGCGAFISHIVNQAELLFVTLSDNQKNHALKNVLTELYNSMSVLGVDRNNIIVEKFETRRFPHARQEILEFLINLKRNFQPEIVFVHTSADIHQDHVTATDETLRAFRGTTVLGFDVLRSSYGFFPNFLVGVDEKDVDLKIRALAEYKTYADKYYFDPEITRSTLIRHGALAEQPFAEGFDILRIVASFECESAG
jgi:LmbE family N-acetylglucosaminyl deacetylase